MANSTSLNVAEKIRAEQLPMIRRSINQKRVAKLAGVSQSTVSLILAGKPIGSVVTRQKVLETAESLGYRPNLLVHGMQTGKTRVVGVMVPPLEFYWREVLYGIHDALIASDHVPLNIWASHHGTTRHHAAIGHDALEQIHRLLDRRVDGVILWPPLASLFQEHVKEFSSRNLPVVTLDHELAKALKADSVGSDEVMGGRLVAKHLLDLGHRIIGHIAGPSDTSWGRKRLTGFQQALMKERDVEFIKIEANVRIVEQGIDEARRLLDRPHRPTAIYAASDRLARGVYHAAAERGLHIPRDLSVIGFSDEDFAAYMNPPLTTIRQSSYEIGRKAAELIMERSMSNNASDKIQRVEFPVQIVVRESTAPITVAATH